MTSAPAEYPDPVEFDNGPDSGYRKWRRDWTSAVMRDSRFGAATWVTALVLAERALSRRRTLHASRRSLAEITGRSGKVEGEHLAALADAGWVVDTGLRKNHATVWRLEWPHDHRDHRGSRAAPRQFPRKANSAPPPDRIEAAGPPDNSAGPPDQNVSADPTNHQVDGVVSVPPPDRSPRYLSAQGHPEGTVTNDDEETGRAGPVLPETVQAVRDTEDGALRGVPTPDDEGCPVAEDHPGWDRWGDCTCGRGAPHTKWFNRQMMADGRRG